MSFDDAVRLTEIVLGLAFVQQSIEHLRAPYNERVLFVPRAVLSLLLVAGIQTPWVCMALLVLGVMMLKRFAGPYNGGSDRMSLLLICGLCLIHFIPSPFWREAIFGYVALQVVLSYFMAGWVKMVNPEWRAGHALRDVFLFTAYPVSDSLRGWANKPRVLYFASWVVMLVEVLFPLALLTQTTLTIGLAIATCFHLANAFLFGLNRFFWIWLAAYPSLLWLQQRLFL